MLKKKNSKFLNIFDEDVRNKLKKMFRKRVQIWNVVQRLCYERRQFLAPQDESIKFQKYYQIICSSIEKCQNVSMHSRTTDMNTICDQ